MNSQDKSKKSGALRRPAKSNSLGILIILLAMCLLLTIAVGKKFLSASNLISVIRQFSFYGILAIGMCMVIITAGIDLSVGSVFALAGVLSCMAITKWHLPVFVGVLIGLAVGVLMGYFNGVCVTLLKLPPMIATLGTMSIARGIAYTVTGGYPIGSLPDSYKFLGLGYIAGIPTPILPSLSSPSLWTMPFSLTARRLPRPRPRSWASTCSGSARLPLTPASRSPSLRA